jgi:hypothetical protein
VRVLQAKAGIPYGIAIAAGAIITTLFLQASGPVNPATNWSGLPIQR